LGTLEIGLAFGHADAGKQPAQQLPQRELVQLGRLSAGEDRLISHAVRRPR
jgi:hypothetical protein